MKMTDAGGTLLSGTNSQMITNNSSFNRLTGDYAIEFKCPAINAALYFELTLTVYNNSTSGTIQITNGSFREIAHVTRPLLITESYLGSPGYPQVWNQLFDPSRGSWFLVQNDITSDGALNRTLNAAYAYNTDRPFGTGNPVDPNFTAATGSVTASLNYAQPVLTIGQVARSHRANNNDQILQVLKQDGVTYELRGNTHGGETLRSSAAPDLKYEYDLLGDGTWTAMVEPFGKYLRPAQRMRWTWNTQIARSSPDSDTVANVDHVTTYFPDGMIRTEQPIA